MYYVYYYTYKYSPPTACIALHCCQQYLFPSRHAHTWVFPLFIPFHPVESVFLLLLFPNDAFYSNPNTTSITYRSALHPLRYHYTFTALINIYLYGLHLLTGHGKNNSKYLLYFIIYKQIVVALKYSRENHCFCFVVFSAPLKNFPPRS